MKKAILLLSAVFVIAMLSCNTTSQQDYLVGKWEKEGSDSISYVLELTENQEWKYYKNDVLAEEGTYVLENNTFIMKHAVVEHDHDHEGDHHEHAHPEDHKYQFALNEDYSMLSFITEDKTSKFIKLQ